MNQISDNFQTPKHIILFLQEWFRYFVRKWYIIMLFSLIGALIGLLYVLPQKTKYTASLSFALEDDKGGGGLSGALGLASQFGIDIGGSAGGAFSTSNLIELFKSRMIIEKTLLSPIIYNNKKISLAELYISYNELRNEWNKSPEMKSVKFDPNFERSKLSLLQNEILGGIYGKLMKSNLLVYQKEKKVSIITIEVKSENEFFSKYFSEALAKEVSIFYIESKTKKAVQNLNILQNQADSLKKELNNAIIGTAIANDNVFNLNAGMNINRVPSSRKQIDVQTNTAILIELVKNIEIAKISLRKETPLLQEIDKPVFPLAKEKKGKLTWISIGGLSFFTLSIIGLTIIRLWKNMMK